MSAWGPEILENDLALDWFGHLEQSDEGLIRHTIEPVVMPEWRADRHSIDWADIYAAAALVASIYDGQGDELHQDVIDWLEEGEHDLPV